MTSNFCFGLPPPMVQLIASHPFLFIPPEYIMPPICDFVGTLAVAGNYSRKLKKR
jgi:hypothetical protein